MIVHTTPDRLETDTSAMASGDKSYGSPWGTVLSNTDMALARLEQARAFLRAQSPDAAIREAQAALELAGGDAVAYEALDVMADAHWLKDEPDITIDLGQRMLTIDHHRVWGYVQVARGALACKSFGLAHRTLEAGLAEHPQHPVLLILMSDRYQRVGDRISAERLVRQALQVQPNNSEALGMLAMIMMETRRRKEGQALLDRIFEINPDAAETIGAAAHAAYLNNRHGDAVRLATAALERDPENRLCRQILARSRIYRNPFMRPFWWAMRLHPIVLGVIALAALACMAEFKQSPYVIAIVVLLVYGAVCTLVAIYVDDGKIDGPGKADRVSLKDY